MSVKWHQEVEKSLGQILLGIQIRGSVIHILRGSVFGMCGHRILSSHQPGGRGAGLAAIQLCECSHPIDAEASLFGMSQSR